MFGFTIKLYRNAKAESGEFFIKTEFFVKTEAESNCQKQNVMDFISKKMTGKKLEKAGEYVYGEHVWYDNVEYKLLQGWLDNVKFKLLQGLADKPDFSLEKEVLAEMEAEGFQLDVYFKEEMLAKYRAGSDEKSKVPDKLEQEQKQLSIIVIKEKVDKTELQEQEQLNVIFVKSPEKMGEVSKSKTEDKKQLDKNVYIANKKKMGQ